MNTMGADGFFWFFGIVEDVANDEFKLYRVRVRVLNEHDDNKTEELPWASVMLPTTSSTFQGASDTPALSVGAMVFGFFADGSQKQMPIVVASLPIFTDKDDNKHSLSMLARGQQIIEKQLVGPEPESPFAAQYPFNRVISTRSGHVIELDDTEGAERVHIYHKSGSYVEIGPDGTTVIKSVTDKYDITDGNATFYVSGDATFECSNVKFTGDIEVEGEATIGGIAFTTHKHGQVQSGSSTTGEPQ